jgi:hypothetical protein
MLTISKPLSASQVRTYHEREFASERQNYWSRDQQGHREWQGKLAEQWGLEGAVGNEHFARLTEGQHPHTEAQLVRHQVSKTYEGKFGKEVTSVEHRAGWDATFSAPKSVSLTALVGGDERVREAHRESVRVALAELEKYTQAASAPRSRLWGDEPFQPGTDRRARIDSRRYRAGRERPAQQPHGIRRRFARRGGRAALHQRPREATGSIRA